jgi:hypothetical protein
MVPILMLAAGAGQAADLRVGACKPTVNAQPANLPNNAKK